VLVTEKPDGGSAPESVSPELLEARIRGLQHALGQLLENARRLTYGEHQRAVQLHRQLQEQTAIARRESRGLVDAIVAEAANHGWILMFADRHPYAGGPQHYAAFLHDEDGYELELVAPD